ncbi:MAG: ribosome recycling factor [Dehalococcoidia bacterium]|nr:ribosome recycling factor [Dehalococcoidia bacterium]MDW8119741.1 ribosome recycling factor [Chloroflexota bacterium]
MTTHSILADAENRMKKAVEVLRRELQNMRTGRAHPALLDRITVDYYGTPTPITQLATVTAPDARLLIVQPWDKNTLRLIERAILNSDLGITPTNDGQVLRLPIPPLTEERRRELVRLVHKKVEEGRIAIRNIRRDALEKIRSMERNKELGEDDSRRTQERLQKLTDTYIGQMDTLGQEKEKEILAG